MVLVVGVWLFGSRNHVLERFPGVRPFGLWNWRVSEVELVGFGSWGVDVHFEREDWWVSLSGSGDEEKLPIMSWAVGVDSDDFVRVRCELGHFEPKCEI